MADYDQVNVRLPRNARDAFVRLARMVRDDPKLVFRLNRFLEEETSPEIGGLLSQRVERLEQVVAELVGTVPALGTRRGRLRAPPPSMFDARQEKAPVWITGSGNGRRLTVDGEAELHRMIAEGRTNSQIAARLGVRAFTVARQRRKL